MFTIDFGYIDEIIHNGEELKALFTEEEKEIYENEFTFDLFCDEVERKENEVGRNLDITEVLGILADRIK